MTASIKSFSCDSFWVTVNETCLSLGAKQLPHDVHFTISFHPNDEFYNLHLTRNGKGIATSNKPKITIVKINKNDFGDLLPFIAKGMLSVMLNKVDDGEFRKLYNRLIFVHTNAKQNKNYAIIEKETINVFKKISKLTRRKTKIEIKGDIDSAFERIEDLKAFQNWTLSKSHLTAGLQKKISSGMIAIQDNSTCFLKINRSWYKLNNPSFKDILFELLPKELADGIISHYTNAIEQIQLCNSYDDSREFDKPIVLSKRA